MQGTSRETVVLPARTPPVSRPRLRPLQPTWVRHAGEAHLYLRDPLQLSGRIALIPESLVPLVPLMDGSRDVPTISAEYARSTGVALPPGLVGKVVAALDDALLLEGPRLAEALDRARGAFRGRPFREPALAGPSYPATPDSLDELLQSFAAAGPPAEVAPLGPIARAAGVLSPHIDFHRGGPVYAATWGLTMDAVATAEVVVIFGTDHWGSQGQLTVTPQQYATPWGPLPSDPAAVAALADALGPQAHAEELHHVREHAIELAAVWLHWALRRAGRDARALPAVVPILCGSFHCYTRATAATAPGAIPEEAPHLARALDALSDALAGRRALVVSAADLAHVGPAFGDPAPLGSSEKEGIADSDRLVLAAVASGDATALLARLRAQEDRTRVCGLPPTYWAMRLLERLTGGTARGRVTAYAQCPADETFGSLVSIAGALWE